MQIALAEHFKIPVVQLRAAVYAAARGLQSYAITSQPLKANQEKSYPFNAQTTPAASATTAPTSHLPTTHYSRETQEDNS